MVTESNKEIFEFDLEICPIEEHRIGDSDRVVPQMVLDEDRVLHSVMFQSSP